MKQNKKILCLVIICVILLLIDQMTKWIIAKDNINVILIPNVFEIKTVQNTGGAFGVGQGNTPTFIITNIIVLGLIIRFIYLQKDFMDKITLSSLFVILAGGMGNLIDRIARGYVVDFINIFPKLNIPTFNFADIYITIGWIVFAFVFAYYTFKEFKTLKNAKE